MPRPAEVVGWELHQGLWELENSQDTWKLAVHANESAATMLEPDGGLVVLEGLHFLCFSPSPLMVNNRPWLAPFQASCNGSKKIKHICIRKLSIHINQVVVTRGWWLDTLQCLQCSCWSELGTDLQKIRFHCSPV